MWLEAIASGDEGAFGRWMAGAERPLRDSLRSFARSVDVEAVMQETLLRVWQTAHRCRSDGRPNSLLRVAVTVASRLAIDETRRRRLEPPPPAEVIGSVDVPDPRSSPPDPLLRERIRLCLEKLPRQPSRALRARLASAGGESDKEIARRVGMRLNTFLQNVTRSRALLRECLRRFRIEIA